MDRRRPWTKASRPRVNVEARATAASRRRRRRSCRRSNHAHAMSTSAVMQAIARPCVHARVAPRTQNKAVARRTVVAAVSEPEAAAADADDEKKTRRRFPRKNITVQEDQVVVGASFTGKVKRIQDYGCFVDFGAKTDGLVHISELQAGFVDKVSEVVSEDQEVKVWIKEIKDNKISLTMKQPPTEEELAAAKSEQEAKFAARQAYKKAQDVKSQAVKALKKGQKIEGEVKSIQPFGAFVEVAEGVEGLVHITELSDDFNVNVEDFCKVGEKVTVTVIGIEGAKVKLSMKEKLDLSEMNAEAQSVVDNSASALEYAFKKKGISADMFPKGSAAAAAPAPAAEAPKQAAPAAAAAAAPAAAPAAPAAEKPKAAAAAGGVSAALVKQLRDATGAGMMDCKKALAENNGDIEEATVFLRKKGMASADKKASRIAAEGAVASYIHAGSRIGVLVEVNCETDFVARGDRFKELAADIAMQVAACPDVEYVNPSDADQEMVERERAIEMQKEDLLSKPEAIRAKIVQGRIDKMVNEKALTTQDYIKDTTKTVDELVKEATAELGEKISIRRFQRFNLGEGIEKRVDDFAAEVAAQTQVKAEAPAAPKVEKKEEAAPAADAVKVDAKLVKQLRDATGAGMMDCKKALAENNNNIEEATAFLRKKGMASADKKASRIAAEGAVASYIHAGSRIGVLVEVNCETDFVARGDRFKALAADIAMQVAACPDIEYVNPSDADQEMVERERAIEMQKEDLLSKPEAIRAKIVQGRIDKMVNEKALTTQDYIKDTTKTVEEFVKEATAELGEKISIRRFQRFNLGEGIEKKVEDFAAEVAAQMGK